MIRLHERWPFDRMANCVRAGDHFIGSCRIFSHNRMEFWEKNERMLREQIALLAPEIESSIRLVLLYSSSRHWARSVILRHSILVVVSLASCGDKSHVSEDLSSLAWLRSFYSLRVGSFMRPNNRTSRQTRRSLEDRDRGLQPHSEAAFTKENSIFHFCSPAPPAHEFEWESELEPRRNPSLKGRFDATQKRTRVDIRSSLELHSKSPRSQVAAPPRETSGRACAEIELPSLGSVEPNGATGKLITFSHIFSFVSLSFVSSFLRR